MMTELGEQVVTLRVNQEVAVILTARYRQLISDNGEHSTHELVVLFHHLARGEPAIATSFASECVTVATTLPLEFG
jgi:hypothetical protein